jgi:hypothetical protein
LTGVAVNVTPVPEQTVLPGKAVMLTVGVTGDVTVMVMPVLVAVPTVTHVRPVVITTSTTSPSAKPLSS